MQIRLVFAALALAGATTVAAGQTRPAAESPFWSGDSTSFPIGVVSQVAPAKAEAVGLAAQADEAMAAYRRAKMELTRRAQEEADLDSAVADVRQAAQAVREAREAALAPLAEDAEYQAARDLSDSLANQAQTLADDLRTQELLDEAFAYSLEAVAAEQALLEDDESYQDAQAAYERAITELRAARSLARRSVTDDPELQELWTKARQLQAAAAAANVYAKTTGRIADAAVEHARLNVLSNGGYFEPRQPYAYEDYGYRGYHRGYNPYRFVGRVGLFPTVGAFPSVGVGGPRFFPTQSFPTPIITTVNRQFFEGGRPMLTNVTRVD
jgi:hypothetical protein